MSFIVKAIKKGLKSLFGSDKDEPKFDEEEAEKKAEKAVEDRKLEKLKRKQASRAGLLSLGGQGDPSTPRLGAKTLGSK